MKAFAAQPVMAAPEQSDKKHGFGNTKCAEVDNFLSFRR